MEELNKDSHTFKHRPYYYHQKLRTGTLIAITPAPICDPQMAIAAIRAGEIGILDLGYRNSKATIHRALSLLARFAGNNERWGIRWDTLGEKSRSLSKLADIIGGPIPVLILGGVKLQGKNAAEELKKSHHLAHKVLVEVSSLKAARAAQKTGYDGVIIKGHEAGGWVGNESSFILLQHLYKKLDIPYWIQGGIGLHTASAVLAAAATGVVLCEQLWLTEESPFSLRERNVWERIDGSETTCIGQGDKWFRCFSRSGRAKLHNLELSLAKGSNWLTKLNSYLLITDDDPLIPIGQDIAFAARLAKKFGTVGRILTAIRRAMVDDLKRAKQDQALAPNSPLAKAHNTLYPIVQGPMTRVSDVTPFCEAVATNGGLPFLGIGLMRAGELRILLTETKTKIGDLPWGVGILGFLPPELRKEQIEVICEISPPFAIISGGHPGQAARLEAHGITTYLHVPSPGLLEIFIKDGARKFIFEGRECGGHVGPLTSFILWELAVQRLLEADIDDPEKVQILFAGGIHDGLSACMVATLAVPLTSQGMKIGLLMGTVYLFTEEAVATGAINPEYQAQAIACRKTILLESAAGYATRCAKTSFADEFNLKKGELFQAGEKSDEIRMKLEFLSVGHLRIAAKGITRNPNPQAKDKCDKFIKVDRETQRNHGLFLMGQVASLRAATLSVADLHNRVSEGSKKYLSALTVPPIEKEAKTIEKEDIAIVGMACMFPEASNLKEYWQNIINRVDTIHEVNDERWRPADYFDPDPQVPDKTYSKWGGFLKEIRFDSIKYGIPPASIPYIETMQLLALEVAWQALEDAGYNQHEFPRESTSVIFGVSQLHDLGIDYVFRTMLMHYLSKVEDIPVKTRQEIIDSLYSQLPKWTSDSFPGFLGNIVAGRVANRLNFGGSNFTVDAACASSLAAVEVAIKQLQMRDCDVALVGAVDGTTHAVAYLAFSKTYALSPRGRVRPFDDSTDGTVISEGAAALVLKRLGDAKRDGDQIYAVIKGIGTSSDGRNRSLVAPAPEGQVRALRRAYKNAGVSLSTVELIEAHGTGTPIGDKVEIESLDEVFENTDPVPQYCAIGSIKSMIGHCKAAAGMAGLIKTALSLKHKILPPTIGVEVPNSLVDFSQTPFYINTESRCWFASGTNYPRRAGVSAFGFGGSNFHVVLEEYTKDYRESRHLDISPREAEIFSWVRTSRAEIQEIIKHLSGELEKTEITDLAQLAYSVFLDEKDIGQKGRKQDVRLDIVATSITNLKEKLKIALNEIPVKSSISRPQGVCYSEDALRPTGSVCFLFPGQGSQSINMLRDLVLSTPKTHSIFELADELLRDCFEQPLSRYIYPLPVFSDSDRSKQQLELNKTHIAQPALAVVDLVAYDLLKTYGIEAEFMVGHSFGEYVALCAAGALSQQDLIFLSAIRGKLVQEVDKTNPGTMAAVQADAEKTSAALKESDISATLANLNAPNQTIIAGPIAVIDKAVKALNAKGLLTRKIPVTSAFHTTAMSEVGKKLTVELAKIGFHKPQCKVYSNTTAGPYPDSPEDIRALLARHITRPVQFEKQIRQMYEAGARIFIEVGPGRVLTGLVERILNTEPHVALSLDVKGRSGWRQLAHLLAQTRNLGLPINLKPWFENRQLAIISTDEVFKKAQAYASPSALAWRIYDGKVSLWHQARLSKPVKSSLGHVAGPVQNKKLTNAKEMVMPKRPQEVPKPILNQDLQPLGDTGTDPVVTQFQAIMTEFLKLQQEQQQITERLVAIQEQIMATYLHGQGTTLPKRAVKRGVPLGGVPPAPVLPKLPARPSVNNVTLAPSSPPETGPRETATVQPSAPKAVTPVNDSRVLKEIPTTEEFQESLLRVTSERTGYPLEMLGLDLDLEGDLGLDSIKLVEIISALRNYHNLLQQDEEGIIDAFTGLKTLRSIVDWYDGNRLKMMAGAPPSEQNTTSEPVLSQPAFTGEADNLFTDPLQRFILKSVPVPLSEPSEKRVFPKDHIILLIGEAPQLSLEIYGRLAAENYRVHQIIPGKKTRVLKNNRFEVDLSSLESVQELRALITQSGDIVGGIFNLMGVAEAASNNKCNADDLDDAKYLFLVIKVFEADLKESARRGGGLLVNFSGMDGQFGLQGKRSFSVGQAGCVGLLKAVAREWPEVRVKCIDVDLNTDSQILSVKIWQELTALDGIIEVGLNQKDRWKIDLQKDASGRQSLLPLPINSQSIILVTGGSRGITAEVTKALAAKCQPHLVIVGRTPFPKEESSQTRDLQNPQLLRKYLIQKLRQKQPNITPVVIEQHLQNILKQRQIRSNLAAMKEAGAQVEYYALDVRDQKLFAKFLDDIYARWGKIDGIIHGAGITEDKLIKDKTPESFSRVFATKVTSAIVLAEKLRPETLKFLVFFSSVAGRFGNIGQSDYSAANEVLNKLAVCLDRQWPGRIVSINWGPWNAGLVNDELRKLYASKGIKLIPLAEGVKFFIEELHHNAINTPEVVITRSLKQISQFSLRSSAV